MKTFSSNDILDRLKIALSITSDKDLGDILGISKGAVSNWRKRNSIDLERVFSVCEHVSFDWLISGSGEMRYDNKRMIASNPHLDDGNEVETRPRIPLDAAAGVLSVIAHSVTEAQCERLPIISRFPKYDFTIMVKGDSMEPEFCSGDEIACRFIDEPSFIQWGRPHVLDTNQGVVLKRIYNRSDAILCKSDNHYYEDFEIPKEDIFHIALVVGSVRLY